MKPLVVVGLLAGALGAQQPAFVDRTEARGVVFDHQAGPLSTGMGGGAAWFDMDRDGDDDLVLTSANGTHRLFRYDGPGFTNVTSGSGLLQGADPANLGVAVADYDDDGFPDVYLTNDGPNVLLRNQGDGTFLDVTDAVGAAGAGLMTTAAAWADFDLDGDLDLYLGNYVLVPDFPYHVGAPNELLVHEGTPRAPVFVDRAVELGVDGAGVFGPPPAGFEPGKPGQPTAGLTLSVSTHDYDDDGDADLLIGNDFGLFNLTNRLYRNDSSRGGPLVFTDVSDATGFGDYAQYNMGINASDIDRDGDWDFYLSNLGPNLMLRCDGDVFTDVTEAAGPVEGNSPDGALLRTSWSTIWFDVDNDGWEDLYVVNGHIPVPMFIGNEEQSPNGLWRNLGDGTFALVPKAESGLADECVGRGAVATDLDADGRFEVYLVNNGKLSTVCSAGLGGGGVPQDDEIQSDGHLFEARTTGGGHWAQFRLAGTRSNVEALGARVDAWAQGRLSRRQVKDDSVYVTSPSRLVHFGLGSAETIDRLVVRWPSGTYQELHEWAVDVRTRLVEPDIVLADARAVDDVLVVVLENLVLDEHAFVLEVVLREGGLVMGTLGALGTVPGEASRTLALALPHGVHAASAADLFVRVRDTTTGGVDERVLSR